MSNYARPVNPTNGRISTWRTHTNRRPASSEPGTDYYCEIGTPIRAAASGRIADVGNSIHPATGRYVTIDLDDGRRVRYLHILRRHVNVGDRVQWGQHIADSGATGYGEEDWSWNVADTGGAHVHMTLFRNHSYTFGRYATLDPELYMAANQGGNSSPATTIPAREEEGDDMGYYFYDVSNPNRPYRWFSEGRGKSRDITTPEWEARKAIASTGGGVKYQLVPVSANWYNKIVALGSY